MNAQLKEQLQLVKTQLTDRNVRRVALVDDAYDCPESMTMDEWLSARDDPFSLDIDSAPELADGLDALLQVHRLRQFLERALELDVRVFGQEEAKNALAGYRADLWFFDLFWGEDLLDPTKIAEGAAMRARSALIQYKAEDEDLPLVILMSSNGMVLEDVKSEFTRRAEVPLGCFETLHKPSFEGDEDEDDAALKAGLLSRLEDWTRHPDFRRRIFHFVRSVRDAANQAKEKFVEVLEGLAVRDYAYILREGIWDDGHALGDYLLWLMEPLFIHHVHEDQKVRQARANLDAVQDVEGYLPLRPSQHFQDMYQYRVWKKARDLELEKVELQVEQKKKVVHELMHLYQGDLLQSVDEPGRAWLVVSPSCDLAYQVGRRAPDPDVSVYLLEGDVRSTGAATQGKGKTTRFFSHEGKSALIVWDPKRVRAIPYKMVPELVTKERLERKWCLRRKYVLELVHMWSTHVSRVGLPVAPPTPRKAGVSLYVRDGENIHRLKVWSEGAWFERSGRDETRAWLDESVAKSCAEALSEMPATRQEMIRATEILGSLSSRQFRVSLGGTQLWKGAGDHVKGVLGRGVPSQDSRKTVIFLAIHDVELGAFDEPEEEVLE